MDGQRDTAIIYPNTKSTVLPTGGGKSDILFLSALYERQNGRITLLVLPFVALRYDLLDRGRKLGLRITEWSANVKRESIIESDIIVISVESIDSGVFRNLLTELLISKEGNSLVARIFFDEAHTILGQWDFRPSFHAITNLTSLSIPVVLLSATVPPSKVDRIRKAYNRLDLRIIRAASTMRLNIAYCVTHVPGNELRDNLRATIISFFTTCQPTDRALVFCMSVAMTEDLYNDFSVDQDRIYFYHGQLKTDLVKDVLQRSTLLANLL
ncbi:P-loop containing nucleoside triphosphate hydrolase protein [Lipomyces starkeyi]